MALTFKIIYVMPIKGFIITMNVWSYVREKALMLVPSIGSYGVCAVVSVLGLVGCLIYGSLLSGYMDWNSSKKYHEEELDVLRAECLRLKEQHEEDYKKCTNLKLELVTLDNKKTQLVNIEKRLIALQNTLSEKQQEDSRIDGEIAHQKTELQDKQKTVAELITLVSEVEANLAKLTVQINNAKDEQNRLNAGNTAIEEETKKKNERLQQIRTEISEIEQQKQTLLSQINDLQQTLSEHQGRINASTQEEVHLAERLNTLRSERDAVQKQTADLQSKLDSMSNSRANSKRIEQENALSALQESYREAEDELKKKSEALKNVTAEMADLTRRRDVLKTECDGLSNIKTEKQTLIDGQNRDVENLTKNIQELNITIQQKLSASQTLQNEITEHELRKSALMKECLEVDAILAQKRKELKELQGVLQSTQDNLEKHSAEN